MLNGREYSLICVWKTLNRDDNVTNPVYLRLKKSLQLNNQKLNLKAVPKPILKNSSNYDQNQSFPGFHCNYKLESINPRSRRKYIPLEISGLNAYLRYRSSTPKKTVSDLGFKDFVIILSIKDLRWTIQSSTKSNTIFKT